MLPFPCCSEAIRAFPAVLPLASLPKLPRCCARLLRLSSGLKMVNAKVEKGDGGPPRWHALEATDTSAWGLKVSNSLCNDTMKRVPFVPKNGRQVTWYICGPTVYDSSHVGHARTYLSFDIIRRILEDYFGYELFYVMNVTDVDDKIIKRARQNYLLDRYLKANQDPKQVLADIETALDDGIAKQQAKVLEVSEAAEKATGSQQKTELTTQIAQEELKLRQLREAAEELKGRGEAAAAQGGAQGVELLLAVGKDALAAALDAKEGSSVTDHSIFRAHAAKYEEEFFEDMDALGIRRPDVLTRVTEYIPSIIEYVMKILANGLAYAANGSVYFDTRAFIQKEHKYGKLNPGAVGSAALAAESEANFETSEKRDKKDFALWKASKPGEPFWESPWGNGRPGWHIECSAMASDIIGGNIDIHSGGWDLKFPHHDNELAQAEAYHSNHQWVNYFLHTGHLHIEGLKMSKSLKNFVTIREALEKYTARQIRLLFVLQAWDKPMNFGESAIAEALGKEKQLRSFFQNVQVALRKAAAGGQERWEAEEKELQGCLARSQTEVRERLEDNFDTGGAMGALSTLMTAVNVYLANAESTCRRPRALLIRKAANYVTQILSVFGLVEGRGEEIGFGSSSGAASGSTETVVGPYLDAFLSFREEVRAAAREGAPKEEFLGLCDKVRDFTLVDLGVRCEDKAGGGSVWKLDDPLVLSRERDEKAARAAAEALKKAENKMAKLVKEREKVAKDSAVPTEMFKAEAGKKYGAFDANGVPTHDADGKELSKGARKGAEKEFKKQSEAFEKYKKKLEADPNFLPALDEEIVSLEKEITRMRLSQPLHGS